MPAVMCCHHYQRLQHLSKHSGLCSVNICQTADCLVKIIAVFCLSLRNTAQQLTSPPLCLRTRFLRPSWSCCLSSSAPWSLTEPYICARLCWENSFFRLVFQNLNRICPNKALLQGLSQSRWLFPLILAYRTWTSFKVQTKFVVRMKCSCCRAVWNCFSFIFLASPPVYCQLSVPTGDSCAGDPPLDVLHPSCCHWKVYLFFSTCGFLVLPEPQFSNSWGWGAPTGFKRYNGSFKKLFCRKVMNSVYLVVDSFLNNLSMEKWSLI